MIKKHRTLVVSTSGGETSAFMLGLLLDKFKKGELDPIYTNIAAVFANTGQENEETLIFVKRLEDHFGIPITWVEGVQNHGVRKSADYRIVDFETADRQGKVFEDYIKKYGLPNVSWLGCTRSMKSDPIAKWCRDNFGKDGYDIAIGIRLDEKHREGKGKNTEYYRLVYPLLNGEGEGYTKQDVLEYWEKQPFRLGIHNYQGNCQWCYKKSDTKLALIHYENPEAFDFPMEMEKKHGLAGVNLNNEPRKIFRKERSTLDIIKDFRNMIPDQKTYLATRDRIVNDYNESMFEGGCSESCEAFTEN